MLNTVGSKMEANSFVTNIECEEFVGVYPVEIQHTENGDKEYVVSSDPTGYLLVYKNNGQNHSIYMDNTVGTSCLADLL